MSDKFIVEIISPDKLILNSETNEVIIPSYDGQMGILKDHISLITFLRPGFIEVENNNKTEKFYVEDGTVEFFDNKLLILSTSAIQVEKLTKDSIEKMLAESKIYLEKSKINDKEKYILSYKISSLQEIN